MNESFRPVSWTKTINLLKRFNSKNDSFTDCTDLVLRTSNDFAVNSSRETYHYNNLQNNEIQLSFGLLLTLSYCLTSHDHFYNAFLSCNSPSPHSLLLCENERTFFKNCFLCSIKEGQSYGFGIIWQSVNDERLFIFG